MFYIAWHSDCNTEGLTYMFAYKVCFTCPGGGGFIIQIISYTHKDVRLFNLYFHICHRNVQEWDVFFSYIWSRVVNSINISDCPTNQMLSAWKLTRTNSYYLAVKMFFLFCGTYSPLVVILIIIITWHLYCALNMLFKLRGAGHIAHQQNAWPAS